MFEREPKWGELLLPEPLERVRELQDDEAAALDDAMRDDYGPFFAFVRASGLRQRECITLRWTRGQFRHQADRAHSARAAGVWCSRSPTPSARYCSRCRASIPISCSPMSRSTATGGWARCAASAIRSPSTEPSRHGSGCGPRRASRISASTISGTTSAPSCCARPATSSWCRRRSTTPTSRARCDMRTSWMRTSPPPSSAWQSPGTKSRTRLQEVV